MRGCALCLIALTLVLLSSGEEFPGIWLPDTDKLASIIHTCEHGLSYENIHTRPRPAVFPITVETMKPIRIVKRENVNVNSELSVKKEARSDGSILATSKVEINVGQKRMSILNSVNVNKNPENPIIAPRSVAIAVNVGDQSMRNTNIANTNISEIPVSSGSGRVAGKGSKGKKKPKRPIDLVIGRNIFEKPTKGSLPIIQKDIPTPIVNDNPLNVILKNLPPPIEYDNPPHIILKNLPPPIAKDSPPVIILKNPPPPIAYDNPPNVILKNIPPPIEYDNPPNVILKNISPPIEYDNPPNIILKNLPPPIAKDSPPVIILKNPPPPIVNDIPPPNIFDDILPPNARRLFSPVSNQVTINNFNKKGAFARSKPVVDINVGHAKAKNYNNVHDDKVSIKSRTSPVRSIYANKRKYRKIAECVKGKLLDAYTEEMSFLDRK